MEQVAHLGALEAPSYDVFYFILFDYFHGSTPDAYSKVILEIKWLTKLSVTRPLSCRKKNVKRSKNHGEIDGISIIDFRIV